MKHLLVISLFLVAFLIAVPVSANTLFFDDFESGLSQWTGKNDGAHSGQIITDPLNGSNNALNFTQTNSAGDIFTSANKFSAGKYILSFDYLGLSRDQDDSGGYVGISQGYPDSHKWLWATGTVSGAQDVLIDDGAWNHYDFVLDAAFDFHLMLEDFSGAGNGLAGDAVFDNIKLSATPEPGTFLLLAVGILGLMGYRRKQNG